MTDSSPRAQLQQSLADELRELGLDCNLQQTRLEKGGTSRDIYFSDDAAAGFHGRLRVFSREWITVWLEHVGSVDESMEFSQRYDDARTAVAEIARFYSLNRTRALERGSRVRVSAPSGRPVSPSQPTRASAGVMPSPTDVEAVRTALLARAADTSGDDRREFAEMAVKLGATADELLRIIL